MKSSRQFHNLFIPNHSSNNSQISSSNHPTINESQYFERRENYKSQNNTYSNPSIYIDKNASTQYSTSRNSGIFQSSIQEKRSSVLERSKSQIIQPIYVSPFKKDITQDINQSNYLALSKASQVTFAKPSQFLVNYQKQSFCFDTSQKNIISYPQTVKNDYGYQNNNIYSNHTVRNESNLRVLGSMKSAYMTDNYNQCKKSIIVNQNQITVFPKFFQNSIVPSKTTITRPLKTTVIFKNQPTDYGIKPELRRALSTISIMSGKSRNQSSSTKVNFNYISPPKSENKMTRKLSFRKEDVNNPLNKLTRKKELSKNKLQKSLQNKINKPQRKIKKLQSKINEPQSKTINNEVVNEYFPEFKLKRNKIKNFTSPLKKLSIHKNIQPTETIQKNQTKITSQITKFHKINSVKDFRKSNKIIEVNKQNPLHPTNQGDKNQHFQEDERRNNTFIAGLDGFSQLSEMKIRQKQQSTDIDTPKKTPLFEFKLCDTESKKKIDIDFSKSNQIQGYRITLTGRIHPLGGYLNPLEKSQKEVVQLPQQSQQQISKIQKDSEISIDSLKHGQELQFLYKNANDSENTTDYQQEIVRKLKQQLGLNFSYYKK